MTEVFGSEYAGAYDELYRDKNYVEESELIDRLLRIYGDGPIHSILDLGCGTGNHVFPLVERGHTIVGVDRSSEMLKTAREKALKHVNGGATFCHGDIRTFDVESSFDVSLMMFAVLSYQVENCDVLAALRTARKHTRVGGLLLFDVWYGPAVLSQKPSDRIKTIPTATGQILRVASGQLNTQQHLCKVTYQLWKFEGNRLAAQTEETHLMRYFFPLELSLFLECSGF